MTTVIIDYGSGNLHSAEKAFQRMAARDSDIIVTDDPEVVATAERIVLPGVGAFADCQRGLMAVDGMFETIADRVGSGHPFLGICVGMQLMATRGLEHGETPGFDWIPGDVVKLEPNDPGLKIPHMGWNELSVADHPLFEGIATGSHAYFVHSYHLHPRVPEHRIAHTAHGEMVTAAVARGNMAGTQFHPEKSQEVGLRLIANFLDWTP
ncbi:imidazole glycerol phosphate synthase subunit HisH [Rhodobacteraceae bacterium NNCM2]|nr:imidazole glycerol phosphate synthase subunit HisH [Coraliihabitans acroporae]